MGYVYCQSPCGCCGVVFSYNPVRVPSHRFGGTERQPICRNCMEAINARRKGAGLEPFTWAADAYDAADESELS